MKFKLEESMKTFFKYKGEHSLYDLEKERAF